MSSWNVSECEASWVVAEDSPALCDMVATPEDYSFCCMFECSFEVSRPPETGPRTCAAELGPNAADAQPPHANGRFEEAFVCKSEFATVVNIIRY